MDLADIGIERDVPIYVRAMVVTEDAICTAGQLDVIEETAPMRSKPQPTLGALTAAAAAASPMRNNPAQVPAI